MSLEIEAVYENGVLVPSRPLPLKEHERVTVAVRPKPAPIEASAGLVKWSGAAAALDYLLGPDNSASSE